MEAVFVIVGGGIAGVTCAETIAFLEPEKSIILLSESSLIKTVANLHAITRTIQDFDIKEMDSEEFSLKYTNVKVVHDTLIEINDENHYARTNCHVIKYEYICICTGAEPKMIPQANCFEEIIGIRDTDSVDKFLKKINNSKKIIIIGNGGIASELVFKIKNIEIHWVIKDKHVTATFVDPGAAEFFQTALKDLTAENTSPTITKRIRYNEEDSNKSGAALGPDWYKNLNIIGAAKPESSSSTIIHYGTEVISVEQLKDREHSIEVLLSNGNKLQCDLIISATGVTPRINFATKNPLLLSKDGGIRVNQYMQTNLSNIYSAGDVCTADWPLAKHWFQMKLWTQARHMGCYAAKSMVGHLNKEEILQDFCFEMFAHSTRLFNYKVILLGLFNGQKLGTNYEMLIRMTRQHEYIKFVLENNRLQGAILIGDTDLEEMAENLILNQIDLSPYGDDILNPDIDIEDYFD